MHRRTLLSLLVIVILGLAGCGGHKRARVDVPPPPSVEPQTPTPPASASDNSVIVKKSPGAGSSVDEKALSIPPDATPLLTETGLASWYGAPYHNRRGSNGELYDMNAMTAAHRTLPLGSIVRVTNEKTGQSALLRITDRGPFVDGRILDVSFAAAKRLDIWQPGVARIKLEVMQSPASLATGGRWAVQIGSFGHQKEAADLVAHLARRYQTVKIAKFVSPVGNWWVRVRVQNDDRQRAESLARETETREGSVYLVRLD